MYLATALSTMHTFKIMGELIVDRNYINVMCVQRPLLAKKAGHFICSFILERNHINVMYVAVAILEADNLQFIGDFILERSHINVMYVARPLV